MSVPCQYPMRLFGIGVTCNDRIALLIVVFKWLSFTGSWTWENPFFFYGKDGEDRTRDLTVHNLTSCLRRHCEEVDKKCHVTMLLELLPSTKLVFPPQNCKGTEEELSLFLFERSEFLIATCKKKKTDRLSVCPDVRIISWF